MLASSGLMPAPYRERWAGRFDCLLADEDQDVTQAQYTWLRQFGARHGEVFVVGDDDQSVFSWRGAEIAFKRAMYGRAGVDLLRARMLPLPEIA